MNKARTYDLVIFDWDGTVMDSTGRIVSCMQLAAVAVTAAVTAAAAAARRATQRRSLSTGRSLSLIHI